MKTFVFLAESSLYKGYKKAHNLQDCRLNLLNETGTVIFGSSPKGGCLLSNLQCKDKKLPVS